ncbi:MAG: TlpA disulfide reductase family protein [Janthinobacterium lividum]
MAAPLKRRTLVMGGVAIAAGAAGVGAAFTWRNENVDKDIERLDAGFWSAEFDRPDGGKFDLAAFQGKPLLLNFWATWCPPCIEELPMIDRFFAEQAINGWQVVGMAVDQRPAVEKFLSRMPVAFPVGITGLAGTELMKRLGNAAGGLPFTLVVSSAATIAARKMGKLVAADLDAWRRAQLHS